MNKFNIGCRIKKLREEKKKISQEDMAYQLDISQSYLSKIENGGVEKIDFLLIKKIADYFKIETQCLLNDRYIQEIIDNRTFETGNKNYTNENGFSKNILQDVIKNQQQIENQQKKIFNLIETQKCLIEKLLCTSK